MIENAVHIEGRSQNTIASSAASAKLEPGFYDVWGDPTNALYLKVAADATAPTSSNGYLLRADNTITIRVTKENSVLSYSGTGALHYHQVG